MATLTEHTMLNGLEENLKSAIEYAGGQIPDNTSVWMYPDIIRNQLTGPSEGEKINIIPGEGINIVRDDAGNIIISTKPSSNTINAENITIDAIDAPEFSGLSTWPEGTMLQNLLEDLFYKVIPKIPSIIKGDIIITDNNGGDQYAPELESYIDSLRPNTPYLRLFLVSQKDPIYISMEKLIGIGGTGVVDLSNYYTISQIDSKFDNVYNTINSLEIPKVDPDNYYTKEETNNIVNKAFSEFEFQPDQSQDPITIVEVVDKVIVQEDKIDVVEQTIQNQTEQITAVVEQVNNIDKTIIQKVQEESATEEEAHNIFDEIFEK